MFKKILCLLVIVFLFSCEEKNTEKYENILKGLESNYTLNKSKKRDYLYCLNKSEKDFIKDSLLYVMSVEEFYKQEKDFLFFLLSKKNDEKKYCHWLKYNNPCKSNIDLKNDFMTEKEASILLIDKLLSQDRNLQSIDTLNDLKYEDYERFLTSNKEMNLNELKNHFINFKKLKK